MLFIQGKCLNKLLLDSLVGMSDRHLSSGRTIANIDQME